MAQLPCIGLSWPLTKPPFGSCAIYFHYGVWDMGFSEACFMETCLWKTPWDSWIHDEVKSRGLRFGRNMIYSTHLYQMLNVWFIYLHLA